jgi:hypothetical protein
VLQALAKYGESSIVREKNLAAGLAIPAAEFLNDDGASILSSIQNFNWAVVRTYKNDGDYDQRCQSLP